MKKFSTWPELEDYLDSLGLFHMEAGLERIGAVLQAMELRRPPFVVAQAVGTNGKGSSCAFVASLARSHGVCCGLHHSPHFVSVRERIRLFRPQPPLAPTRSAPAERAQAGLPLARLPLAGLQLPGLAANAPARGELPPELPCPPPAARGGEMFSERAWLDGVNRIMEHGGERLTYFELVTVLAVLLFKAAGVELAVMETGLGGSFDATTALEADLVFFTPIAMDHADILGSSLSAIARDKAGAIRPEVPVISAAQGPEARRELQAAAGEKKAPLHFLEGTHVLPDDLRPKARRLPEPLEPELSRDEQHRHEPPAPKARLPLGLAGRHQLDNAALGLRVWRELRGLLPGRAPDDFSPADLARAELRGLTGAWLPGRLQQIEAYGLKGLSGGNTKPNPPAHPPLILDGAHNPHGIAALGHSLALLGVAPPVTIFSCLRGKQPEKMIPHLRVLSAGLIIVPQIRQHPNAMPAEELAALIGRPALAAKDIREALEIGTASLLERLPEAAEQSIQECKYPLLICGSLYLLAEFYQLYPQYLL